MDFFKAFFFEKRSKKLLLLRPRQDTGPGRQRGRGGESKSLLVPAGRAPPFFRKELLAS
jgi:hypothetical protein